METTELVIAKMSIALTKATISIQGLNDMESKLEYNEDNLQSIKLYLDTAKKAKKVIADAHKEIKEPFLKECQTIDASRREMDSQIDEGLNRAQDKYTKLCQDIENRKRQQELERQRKQQILAGIDSNMISFSGRIAECKTNEQLLSIERLINLEKGNKSKYGEFFEQAVEKYTTLTSLLKTQKESIKEFERLEKERLEAEKAGNDEKLIELQEKQNTLEAKIDEAKVNVQETAINSSISTPTLELETELPLIKVKRAAWTWEVVNILETTKKSPAWTKIETVDEKVDEFLKASKEMWINDNKEEVVVNGIRFFIKKSY